MSAEKQREHAIAHLKSAAREWIKVEDRLEDPASEPPAIKVWRFHDAPKSYRELSGHGGDEDWLALVPASLRDAWIPWAEDGSPFGRCSVSRHELCDGSFVLIGAHA